MTAAPLSPGYEAARSGVALLSREAGLIMLSGRDRASYLQGLLTNDIVALTAGQGCYAAYLTAQGRMISDLHVYELGDVILVKTPRATKDVLLTRFDQFIFSEDVQLGDLTETHASLVLVGPGVGLALTAVFGAGAGALATADLHGNRRLEFDGQPVIAVRVSDLGETGLELVGALTILPTLANALRTAGALVLDEATAEVLRIEAGMPLFGRDMDTDTIPLEAGIEARAISFTKGCYVGQEVIIRVLHRGHGRVARKLVGLTLDPGAAVPTAGVSLTTSAGVIGEVTSSAWSPMLDRPIAFGYVKRDYLEPGTIVQTEAGDSATVTALPFASPA